MRDRIAVAFAVLVAMGVVAAGVWFVLLREEGPSREEQAQAVVDTFAAAWEEEDWEALSSLTAGADTQAADAHEAAWARLEVGGADISPSPVTVDRGRADAELDVALTLADLGDWSYETQVTLLREEGEWRVDWTPAVIHPQLEDGLTFAREVTDEPERAPIVDRDGTPLAERREVIVAGIHPTRLDDPQDVVRAFSEHADVPEERVQRLLDRDLNPEWFYPVTVLEADDQRTVDLLRPFPGIVFQREDRRRPVTEELGAHLVGEVGEITAEQLEELGAAYQVGDIVGRSGLERVFEEQLTGEAAGRVLLVREAAAPAPGPTGTPADGPDDDGQDEAGQLTEQDIVEELARFGGEDPQPVRTTLDLDIQRALEGTLADVEGAAGAVVLDTGTAGIRGVVSRPLDEPFNRALDGLYAPGSTFKIVTTAAVIEELGADVTVTCPAETSVGGKTFRNAHDLEEDGEIGLRRAFEVSCNTAFVQLAEQLEDGALGAHAERFGFGTEADLPVPVAGGAFPEPADITERAAAAIGQGRVQASPLHMASVVAAVASGAWRSPTLLQDGSGDPATELPAETVGPLRDHMRAVVESGTGTAAAVGGEPVHGKTGTAEFGEPDADGELPTHAWFVGYRGDLAFAFLVEAGGEGGEVAAPLAARFLEAVGP